jgi:hypothetical protein
MATTTWNVSKDSLVAYNTSSGYNSGAGEDDHLPIGWNSWLPGNSRAYLGFSYSFSGMTAITAATLYLKTSTGYHIGSGNWTDPDVYIDLITSSWSEGVKGADEVWYSSNAIAWNNVPSVDTTNRVTWDVNGASDPATSTWYSVDVTALVQQAFTAGTFYGFKIMAVVEGSGGDRVEFLTREGGAGAYISVTYTTNTAPNAPTSLSPTADAVVNTLTPTLAGTFSDPDAGDAMTAAQVVVYADDGTTLIWDSGSFSATGTSFSKVYAGSALTGNTFYKWKGRTADAAGAWGAYSALQRFKVNSTPNAPTISLTEAPTTDVKTLTPTFNVTHSDPDASDTQMLYYRIILETSAGAAVWDSGDTSTTATVTKQVTYAGPALSWQTAYRWRARTQDSNGAWSAYSSNATFTTHTTGTPISLDPTGSAIATSLTPTLQGARATSDDTLASAQIIVYESDGTTQKWDSGTFTVGVTSTAFSKVYAGAALTAATTYKWKARVTGSIGGTSAYSALQTFVTPDTTTPSITAPLGTAVTPATNTVFTWTRGTNFNIHQLYVYSDAAGTVEVFHDTPSSYAATGSKSYTYTGTLSWNTTYYMKVRVSADGGTNWSPWAGLSAFTMDSAGVPTLNSPTASAFLGAPRVLDNYDSITVPGAWTNGANLTAAAEGTVYQTGRGSVKFTGTFSGTQTAYRTVSLNLSAYGGQTPIKVYTRISSLTSVTAIRIRFSTDATNYAEYTVTPSIIDTWEQKTVTKGSPTATGGTINWANITRIGVVAIYAASVGPTIYVDDLQFDATNPSFDGTTAAAEVISTYRIRVYNDAAGTSLFWDSGDVAGSSTTFSKLYNGSTAFTKGQTYYWQARYVKSTGPTGSYSALTPFSLNTDPQAPSSMTPASGYVHPDSLIPTFSAAFSDADTATQGDSASMFEVEVYRNSDSVLVYSLLKDSSMAGTNSVYDGASNVLKRTGGASPIVNETQYNWRARYRDNFGAVGPWSSYNLWKPSTSPTTTINSPSHLGTVTSSTPTFTWSMSSSGGKAQNSYRIVITRVSDSYVVYDSGQVYSSATSQVIPAGKIVNSTTYDFTLYAWDTDGLVSPAPDVNRFSTSWTAPAAITNFTGADDTSLSSVVLQWTQSALAGSDFRKYTIYRRETGDTEWSSYADITSQSTVIYYDYEAANNVSYDYKITQWKIIPGDSDLESADSDISTVILDTDSWHVVGADRAQSHIFELPVTAAPFSEPVQQEIFEPLGTSRKVVIRGRTLGAEGNLTCLWDTSERPDAVTQIEYIKSNRGPHILKSPFGDIWLVEFSGPTKDYGAGGRMQATLVWTEVD